MCLIMNAKLVATFYRWSAKIQRDTLPELQSLSGGLGFIVTTPGAHDGDPSPPKMLDALAAAYRRDPAGVKLAFRVLGITPTGEPSITIGEPIPKPPPTQD